VRRQGASFSALPGAVFKILARVCPLAAGRSRPRGDVSSWHIASVRPVVMSAVAWHRTCRLREGADRLCPIGQTEHVRFGKCVHTEE
jgi:hypothetical protein